MQIFLNIFTIEGPFDPFYASGFFLYLPRKHQKTRGFLMFSGGIEIDQWHEIG